MGVTVVWWNDVGTKTTRSCARKVRARVSRQTVANSGGGASGVRTTLGGCTMSTTARRGMSSGCIGPGGAPDLFFEILFDLL